MAASELSARLTCERRPRNLRRLLQGVVNPTSGACATVEEGGGRDAAIGDAPPLAPRALSIYRPQSASAPAHRATSVRQIPPAASGNPADRAQPLLSTCRRVHEPGRRGTNRWCVSRLAEPGDARRRFGGVLFGGAALGRRVASERPRHIRGAPSRIQSLGGSAAVMTRSSAARQRMCTRTKSPSLECTLTSLSHSARGFMLGCLAAPLRSFDFECPPQCR